MPPYNKKPSRTKPRRPPPAKPPAAPRDSFRLVVVCESEAEQRMLYERLTQEGRRVRVLTM